MKSLLLGVFLIMFREVLQILLLRRKMSFILRRILVRKKLIRRVTKICLITLFLLIYMLLITFIVIFAYYMFNLILF